MFPMIDCEKDNPDEMLKAARFHLVVAETEEEAITKMEELDDYRAHASCDSAYGEIDGTAIYKIEKVTI